MSGIGLPKGMSRDDAYIQGMSDAEDALNLHLILFSVDDEPYVRVVRNPDEETLRDLVRMVEFRHSTTATVVKVNLDDDDSQTIRDEYEEVV
jgi:hypothetical protein